MQMVSWKRQLVVILATKVKELLQPSSKDQILLLVHLMEDEAEEVEKV